MTTKAELSALEKVFAAEIADRLPYQSKAKIFAVLARQGLIEPMVREHRDRFTVIRIEGWQLTHAGRFLYCTSCDDDDETPALNLANGEQS
jgi:hypothetical protein